MVTILEPNEYNPYYSGYIGLVKDIDLIIGLEKSFNQTLLFLEGIPDNKWSFSYGSGKWTVNEVVQHLLDTERVFVYRALCFARMDKAKLPGFDQDEYLAVSQANTRSKNDLIGEYKAIRNATLSLFKGFSDKMLKQIGVANESSLSVRASGYIIIGHEMHHCNIIRERYL